MKALKIQNEECPNQEHVKFGIEYGPHKIKWCSMKVLWYGFFFKRRTNENRL